jgi:hypothetical protein
MNCRLWKTGICYVLLVYYEQFHCSPQQYRLYKLLRFPLSVHKGKATYGYVNLNKEFILSDSLRQHYGKMTTNELTNCFQPNQIVYVCKEKIPIYK